MAISSEDFGFYSVWDLPSFLSFFLWTGNGNGLRELLQGALRLALFQPFLMGSINNRAWLYPISFVSLLLQPYFLIFSPFTSSFHMPLPFYSHFLLLSYVGHLWSSSLGTWEFYESLASWAQASDSTSICLGLFFGRPIWISSKRVILESRAWMLAQVMAHSLFLNS